MCLCHALLSNGAIFSSGTGFIGRREASICLPAHRQVSGGLKDTLGALKEKVGGVFGSERYALYLRQAHLHSCSNACQVELTLAMPTLERR